MSSILKLRILGVRAFDNHEAQELEFSSPLTLICGPNGVGKTTIIECLRYLTTGDLPPNAKGGAFVHDPRMSSEGEVKAQVKLLFKNSAGHRMVAARNMRLSVTGKGSASFKTLEGYIKVQDKTRGDTGSVSSRCADLNLQIPLALGVPPAILNYVVFCHQEDSLWPLAEPSVVKKRFDEIFEATKYTKALESLKVIRKEYMSNIKIEKVQVDHLKTDRERVQEKHKLLEELSDRIKELQTECEMLQRDRVSKSSDLNIVVEHSQRAQQLEYTVKDIKRQRNRNLQDIELLTSEAREILSTESTETITRELRESSDREKKLDEDINTLKQQRQKLNVEIETAQQKLAVIANQQGRIEQLQEAHMSRVAKRQEAAEGKNINEWVKKQNEELSKLNEEIEDIEIIHRKKEEELAQVASTAEAERLQIRQQITNIRNKIRDYEQQISKISAEIAEHSDLDSEDNIELIKNRLQGLEVDLKSAQQALVQFENDRNIDDAIKAVREAEEQADKSRLAIQEAIDISSAQSRLQFLRDSQRDAQTRLEKLRIKLEKALKNKNGAMKKGEEAKDAKDEAMEILNKSETAQHEATMHLADTKTELKNAQNTLKDIKTKLTKLRDTKTELLSKLSDSNLLENYDEEVQEAENALISATEEQEQLQFAHSFFARALTMAQNETHPTCLLCDHSKTPAEAETLASKLMTKISALNVSPEEAAAETASRRKIVDELRAQKPVIDKISQINNEISIAFSDSEEYQRKTSLLEHKVQSAEHDLVSCKADLAKLESELKPLVHQFSRTMEESFDIQHKLDIETSLSQVSSAAVTAQTPQEAQKHMEKAEQELKQKRAELEKLRMDHDRMKSRVSTVSHGVQELKLRLSDYELKASKRKQAEDQLERFQEQQSQTQVEYDNAQRSIPDIEKKIDVSQKQLRSKKHEFAQIERKLAEKRSHVVNKLKDFTSLNDEITAFEKKHGSDPLAGLRKDATIVQTKIQELTVELNELDERLNELTKQRTDYSSYQRNLNDNLRIRHLQSEVKKIEKELKTAVAELENARSETGVDHEQQIRYLQAAIGDLNHKISTKSGECKALQEQIIQVEHELRTTYSKTEEQYRHAVVKLETSEGASEDLAKYVKALDAAIMQYHSLKMGEINSLLDEMWKRTYTGTDIDTILIRSESDAGSASTRANYNYRVCMVKQDTELDMRGRCSAGQKVLASILIRMALAECFGSSSGLIVLDEPTTNLDRDNIEALAQSLSDIIATRRAQRNFQLIVITHDEHFLAQMNPASYCGHYYRILRDERQLSKIHKMPISSLS